MPIQLGLGTGTADERQGQVRAPFVNFRCESDHKIQRLLAVITGQQLAAAIEIEDAFLATHTHTGVLGGGDQQGGLRPLCLNGLGRYTGRRGDFREGRARVTVGGKQLRRGGNDPRPRRLRLLPTKLGPIHPGR